MKITGIVAEYNPFHNGHKYQIDKVKEKSDGLVCIMSGSFVQRGDVAVCDKWTRCKMALLNGVDLVLELPVCYSLNTAERFSFGSISTLNALGIVDDICFGSESGDIDALINVAQLIVSEPIEVSQKIQAFMKLGLNYPSARSKAYESLIPNDILSTPNNILAIEYICALLRLKSEIIPTTIKRNKTNYHDIATNDNIASATGIRHMIENNIDFKDFVPKEVFEILSCAIQNGDAPYDIENLTRTLITIVRTRGIEYLKNINDVSEGLENRIFKICKQETSIDEIATQIKTKRYTRTRINRILISIILGLTSEISQSPPEYIRVLGMTQIGAKILSDAKSKCTLPIITKVADFKHHSNMLDLDILSTDIATLCLADLSKHEFNADYTHSPIIIK